MNTPTHVFIIHPCNRQIVVNKAHDMAMRGFKRVDVFEWDVLPLNIMFMKEIGKDIALAFHVRNGVVQQIDEMTVH